MDFFEKQPYRVVDKDNEEGGNFPWQQATFYCNNPVYTDIIYYLGECYVPE